MLDMVIKRYAVITVDGNQFIRRHLLSEEDETRLRQPFDDVHREVRDATTGIARNVTGDSHTTPTVAPDRGTAGESVPQYPDPT
jgi:hypothetical protein